MAVRVSRVPCTGPPYLLRESIQPGSAQAFVWILRRGGASSLVLHTLTYALASEQWSHSREIMFAPSSTKLAVPQRH
jgi:hypothetical protein